MLLALSTVYQGSTRAARQTGSIFYGGPGQRPAPRAESTRAETRAGRRFGLAGAGWIYWDLIDSCKILVPQC
jgi:hypothetical protein